MKIYLDTNIYFRTLDDQAQPRIYLESRAILTVFKAIEEKIIQLVTSDILYFEISKCIKKENIKIKKILLQLTSRHIKHTKIITEQTKHFVDQFNILPADAMHLIAAKTGKANWFITCDDILIKKANQLQGNLPFVIMNPVDFVLYYPYLKKQLNYQL